MALNIRDAESSYLTARAIVEKWKQEFTAQWLQPEIDLALVQLALRLEQDPITLQSLQEMTPPDQWRVFIDRIQEAKARLQHGPGK